jgi:hypothetical protein
MGRRSLIAGVTLSVVLAAASSASAGSIVGTRGRTCSVAPSGPI